MIVLILCGIGRFLFQLVLKSFSLIIRIGDFFVIFDSGLIQKNPSSLKMHIGLSLFCFTSEQWAYCSKSLEESGIRTMFDVTSVRFLNLLGDIFPRNKLMLWIHKLIDLIAVITPLLLSLINLRS